jgi:hypothetical protein
MNLDALLKGEQRLKRLDQQLTDKIKDWQAAETDAGTEHARLLEGDLRHFPKAAREAAFSNILCELLGQREPPLGVALYAVERAWMQFEPLVRRFKQESMRAPDPETAWLARTGQGGVNAETHLTLQMLDEQRRARLLLETRDWPPSRWENEYARATADPTTQESATFLRFAESQHPHHWSGAEPVSAAEAEAAQRFRKLMISTQAARVPLEIDQVEQTVTDVRKTIDRAKVAGIQPANPSHRPDLSTVAAELEV